MSDYQTWKKFIVNDKLLFLDNENIKSDFDINDRFFCELEFGTGGLRGKLGLGTNRMNKYVVRRATLGLKDTLFLSSKKPEVAIAYDTRNYSYEFAKEVALTLASNNIKVHIMKEVAPTPLLSFMVRYLKCDAGIVITASHNPKEYNGYKIYGNDGGQITLNMANTIYSNICKHDYFENINGNYEEYIKNGQIVVHDSDVIDTYLESTKKQSLFNPEDKKIKIVYTPLNGAGYKYVTRLLSEEKYEFKVVKEQALPDGNFTTCPLPNPELKDTLILGMNILKESNYDILFATDPDADRCGVAVNKNGNVTLLTGDEVGILLFDFIYNIKKINNVLPLKPIIIKTIATSDLLIKMADKYGVKVIDTLTGFKYIGEQIGILINENKQNDFVAGIEDSCGYLTNIDVRDKDSINAALLIAEMSNYYKLKGITLIDRLNEIYKEFGHYTSCLKFLVLEGQKGKEQIKKMMEVYRSNEFYKSFLDCCGKYDFKIKKGEGCISDDKFNLPISDVLKFYFKDGSILLVRPSGTEPKIKYYYLTPNKEKENEIERKLIIKF